MIMIPSFNIGKPPPSPRRSPPHRRRRHVHRRLRLRLPTTAATFSSIMRSSSLLKSFPIISGLNILKKIWSRLAGCIRAFTRPSPPPPLLTMRAESFQLAGYKRRKGKIEDCHFVYGPTIGVADGVGGFRKHGIDPGEYAEELMINALAAVVGAAADVDPSEILKQAHEQTNEPGGSTCCIITLAGGDQLRFASVGDSGFKVLRGNTVSYESPTQNLGFNKPAKLCAGREAAGVVEGRVRVEVGDFVVAGTDGLFDNLHTWEIQRILEASEFGSDDGVGVKELARTIALTAYRNSIDESYPSPFKAESLKQGLRYRGGKRDDITVVVARIESASDGDEFSGGSGSDS